MPSPGGVNHHSTRDVHLDRLRKLCKETGIRQTMGLAGDCYDNAMYESFFAPLECGPLDRQRFRTQTDARMAVIEFLERRGTIRVAVIPERETSPP